MGMDVAGRKPAAEQGKYFRANVWSWRVIHHLCDTVIALYGLKIKTAGWGFNDGKGLRTQAQCDRLAGALEAWLEDHPPDAGGCYVWDQPLFRVNPDGKLVGAEQAEPDAVSPYQVTTEHLREWLTFLRSCGGFRIW